ncbi:MAG: hypothetical protein IH946_00490, partial [Bacteroidetes bacterium]|nr:hypothetical protein [Bacteroidota bacterium]
FNTSTTIEIAANITDDTSGIDVVLANVTFPNSTINQLTLTNVVSDKYNVSFNIPDLTGIYNITFIANDSSNNVNSSETTSFNATDVTAPLVTINVPENITYSTSSFDFNVSLNEDGDTVQYTLDDGINNITMSTTDNRVYNATNDSIADGGYTFQVYTNDTVGNNNYTEDVTFTVDTTEVDDDTGGGGGSPIKISLSIDRGTINVKLFQGETKKEIEEYSNELPLYKRIFSFDISEENSLPKTSTLKFKKFEIKKNINKIKAPNQEKIQGKMDNKDFIINVLKKVSGKKDVDMDSHLELDLHLDSLAISEIISNIEEKFKIKIEYNLNVRLNKVRDMVEFVNEYLKDEGNIEKLQELDINETGIPRRTDFSNDAKEERLRWLGKIENLELDHLKGKYVDTEKLKGNIEHYIGMSQVPTGISGPIKVNGQFAKGDFYVPFATTEGALVASVNRGMSIISKSGGANVGVIGEQMTKAPMFIFKSSGEAIKFHEWIDKNYDKIKERAESTTRYGKLVRIDKYLLGRRSILRMCYSCGDALGSNMITMATQEACNFIKSNYEVEDYMLQCNLEGEKKVSFLNFLTGRGKRVYAEVTIPKNIVENFLHTTPERIATIAKNSSYGSMISGMIGVNAHIANILTAIFIATGQDVAHVHDSSVGITTIDLTKDGSIYFSVNLPSLAVGTIGGGTGLGTQKECLEIMGCYGAGKVKKFAEIVVACVLAGEISLSGSQAAGDFAFAHDKFGRNRPDEK